MAFTSPQLICSSVSRALYAPCPRLLCVLACVFVAGPYVILMLVYLSDCRWHIRMKRAKKMLSFEKG